MSEQTSLCFHIEYIKGFESLTAQFPFIYEIFLNLLFTFSKLRKQFVSEKFDSDVWYTDGRNGSSSLPLPDSYPLPYGFEFLPI